MRRDQDAETRDAKLTAINEEFLPKIAKLQVEHKAALKKVWDEWKAERSER